jgi:hypothetical protein
MKIRRRNKVYFRVQDKWKKKKMGQVHCLNIRLVYLTDENNHDI